MFISKKECDLSCGKYFTICGKKSFCYAAIKLGDKDLQPKFTKKGKNGERRIVLSAFTACLENTVDIQVNFA